MSEKTEDDMDELRDLLGCDAEHNVIDQVRALIEERDQSDCTLDMIRGMEQRAIDRWKAEDPEGRKLRLPDGADLFVWTFVELGELASVEAERDALRAQVIEQDQRIAEIDITRIEWTRMLPTRPGWYWVSAAIFDSVQCINVSAGETRDELFISIAGDDEGYYLSVFQRANEAYGSSAWWMGPLDVPEVPR